MNNQGAQKDGAYDYKKSYVAKDMIWKDYVNKATRQAKQWPQDWGFLHGKVEDIVDEKRVLSVIPEPNYPSPVNNIDTPRSVPKTASQMIGWRSTNTIFQLEKYGPYTKGKQTITKSLRWPHEGVN